ncbi:MAG: DegT/DnrJ/EryC1/StrS family aminotransferase, partial [Patescibacteria group bacterium]
KDFSGARRYAGTIGDFGCLSFNGNKLITTGGGGMILTRQEALADKARYLTTQAKDDTERFIHNSIGYNYRMTNIQAAIGCAQMEKIGEFLNAKRENFEIYRECLAGVQGLTFIEEPPYACSNYWYYTLLVDEKKCGLNAEDLRKKLASREVETRPIWELNHRQKPYRHYQAYKIEKAVFYHRNCLNLPCSVGLDSTLIPKIGTMIKEWAARPVGAVL